MENTINDAIRLAIEKGGYEPWFNEPFGPIYEKITQDIKFWESLGKALGWDSINNSITDLGIKELAKQTALQYFDLLLTGGDAGAFWKELLTNTPLTKQVK